METIGQPIQKDYAHDNRPDPPLRTLHELVRLTEIRLYELEKRISFLEGQGKDVHFIEIVRPA